MTLPKYLGPERPLYAFPHQAEDGKPARYATVEAIAAHHLKEVRRIQAHGPYFLGGYCFGGVVAFEAGQQLRRAGEDVGLLVMLNPPPVKGRRRGSTPESVGGAVERHLREVAHLGPRASARYLAIRLRGRLRDELRKRRRRMNAFAKRLICRLHVAVGRRLPVSLRSFYILGVYARALARYTPEAYDGPLGIFACSGDAADLAGWEALARGAVEVRIVPGGHESVLTEPYVRFFAEGLNACLRDEPTRTESEPGSAETLPRAAWRGSS